MGARCQQPEGSEPSLPQASRPSFGKAPTRALADAIGWSAGPWAAVPGSSLGSGVKQRTASSWRIVMSRHEHGTALSGFLPGSWDHLDCQSWDHTARLAGGSGVAR